MTNEMTTEIALHCMKSAICEEVCEECPMYGEVGTDHCEDDAHRLAIQALEEIQQYRAIGTVEELKKIKGVITDFPIDCGSPISNVEEIWNQLKKYLAIGTIEEFKALKEKSVAKKPILNNPKIDEFYVKEAKLCPACHSYINNCSGDYCRDCGQRIDWSE